MTPRKVTTFRIDEELLEGMREIEERDGVPVSEQVRRSIRAWLESKGVIAKRAERKRVAARRRS